MKRYERYADAIAQLIHSGALRPGERVPSVREASRARGISPSTVFAAYYLLEAQGLIHARPRSGYYVSAPLPTAAGSTGADVRPAEPLPSQPPAGSTGVAISELVFEVLGELSHDFVRLQPPALARAAIRTSPIKSAEGAAQAPGSSRG